MRNSSAAPKEVPVVAPKTKPRKKQTRRRKTKRLTKEEIKRFRRKKRKSIFFLFLSCFVMSATCLLFIHYQAGIQAAKREITKLEYKIMDLREENDTRMKHLPVYDYRELYDRAIELGMHPVREDQIIYYTVDPKNYMDQYAPIPEGD